MKLYHLTSGPLRVNSYFIVNENTNEAVLIDGAENYKMIKSVEEKYGFKIVAELLTHAHFDHAGNAKKLQDDGVKIYISKKDADKLSNDLNLGSAFGRKFEYLIPDYTVDDGEIIKIIGLEFLTVLTPGHTDGSVCYIIEDMMFSGDTLFRGTVGRTDFPTGDREEMVKSVNKLLSLDKDYKVYPGHEEPTTLFFERENNMFSEFE